MKKQMTENLKNRIPNNKGITLIALVITIVVMLILVAVTISMAVNGGLFEYAGKAVGETQNAINQEQQFVNEVIDEYFNGSSSEDKNDGSTGGEEDTEQVISITVEDLEVEEGSCSQLIATITPSTIGGSLTYKSSNESIATVDSTGIVTGVSEGTTTITVSYGSYSATCSVKVSEKQVTLIEFTIESITYYAEEGMNWYEWCLREEYNTLGLSCGALESSVVLYSDIFYHLKCGSVYLDGSTPPLAGGTYSLVAASGQPT